MALSGCNSREREPASDMPRQNASRPLSEDRRPVIAAFGDSLTEGFGVDPSRSYPSVLQNELDRRGIAYRVANLGGSGETSADGLARVGGVAALKPAIVVLEFGANDGLRGVPPPVTRANMEHIVTKLRGSGAVVILAGMTLPPNYGPDYIRGFEAVYKELASKYKLPLIPFFLEGVAGTDLYMQRDGLHPNAAGYARVAGTVLRALEPLLGK